MQCNENRQAALEETARLFADMFKHAHKTLILARKMEGITDHLTAYAYRLMGFIWQTGPASITEIGQHLGIAKSNVSAAVNGLVRQGHLERIPCQTDRRVIRIGVTQRGAAELKQAHNLLIKTFASYFARLSIRDQKRLDRALTEVQNILEKLN
jgi:MarR family 2-MHQ and catechol resistance regulon transcriptional repressor